MKKLFFSLVAVLCCSASLFADDDPERLVATLNHNGALTAYYGITAFEEAMENAENGDEITLSGGGFCLSKSITYNKAVTIRGAGIYDHPDKKTKATEIHYGDSYSKTLTFNLPSKLETDAKLYIEGVSFGKDLVTGGNNDVQIVIQSDDFAEATLSKCYFARISNKGSFLHLYSCKVSYFTILYDANAFIDSQNCIIRTFGYSGLGYSFSDVNYRGKYQHCIVNGIPNILAQKSTLQDCIIVDCGTPYGSSFLNCLFLFDVNLEQAYNQSCYIGSATNVFKVWDRSFDNTFTYYKDFTLKEEAKTLYPSSDGTEIGIYGGNYPYSMEVNLPYVTNLVIGNRTSNGKLPVTIEVK